MHRQRRTWRNHSGGTESVSFTGGDGDAEPFVVGPSRDGHAGGDRR